MDLNGLIYNRMLHSRELTDMLARYCKVPAIFHSEIPADQQPGWEGKDQYPRICFRKDMQVNQERSASGVLHVSLYGRKDPDALERLEAHVRGCLQDVIMKPSGQAPFCVAWAKTEPYLLEGMAVLCKDIVFDILEYPGQETTDPDPILAVGAFIKDMYPEAVELGIDRIVDYVNPAKAPVFYCRLENIQKTTGHCMNSVAWFTAQVAVHLLYPDASVRLKMIAAIAQKMATEGEIQMPDRSPMAIKGLTVNNKADYLREGQLAVNGKYGRLRLGEKKRRISGVGIEFED